MNARWRVRPHDASRILDLSRRSGLSPLLAQLLLNRGIDDPKRAISFLEARMGSLHDPELLPGAVEAAVRIRRAMDEGRKIVIYGDYDVDGVCGTSILWSCLRLAGCRDVDLLHPPPRGRRLRGQWRSPAAAGGRETRTAWSSRSIAASRPSRRPSWRASSGSS